MVNLENTEIEQTSTLGRDALMNISLYIGGATYVQGMSVKGDQRSSVWNLEELRK